MTKQDKMWRPENWEDIKALSEIKFGGREFCWSPSDFEAGADAMLEALRKMGSRAGKFIHDDGYVKETPLIVIIPEEK